MTRVEIFTDGASHAMRARVFHDAGTAERWAQVQRDVARVMGWRVRVTVKPVDPASATLGEVL